VDIVHPNALVNKKYTRKRHWEGVAVKQGKKPGGKRGSPSGGAVPRQQECTSKISTEVEREWEKKGEVMNEEARRVQLQRSCIKYRTKLVSINAHHFP
jgi:hypothetical protein